MTNLSMPFPVKFAWGAASSSCQIEGSPSRGGGGESVWDRFSREPGRIGDGQSCAVTCDHHRLFREDVALIRDLGLEAYRFSIAWPRVLPDGTGRTNQAGLDFYDRLVDELLAAGITPWVTLFHWDLPQALQDRGGWRERASAEWFAEYAGLMARRLGDRVAHWITWNEPQCVVELGHGSGHHAPGLRLSERERAQVIHHLLLAHGRGASAIRAEAGRPVQIGVAAFTEVSLPASPSAADLAAAREHMFENPESGGWSNSWYLDPIVHGRYPQSLWRARERAGTLPEIEPGDLETICQPLDFCGLNIYRGATVRAGADGRPEMRDDRGKVPLTSFKWPIVPESLYWGPRLFHERYGLPIVITENGMSNVDFVSLDGRVHDPQRIDFMTRYLREARRALSDGVDIRGYFAWSILDNFEWCEGYKERFGLVHVDFATQARTPKDSAWWYRDVIRSRGATLG